MFKIKTNFKLSKKEKILAGVVGVVIAVFIFQKLVISGSMAKVKKLNQETKKAEAELLLAMNVEKRKSSIEEDSKTYESFIATEKVSDVKAVTDFLKEIEDIARKSGVSISNLSPESQAKGESGCKKFYAVLRFESSPDQLFTFLNEVQNSRLLIEVDKLVILARDENAASLRTDTTISLTAF